MALNLPTCPRSNPWPPFVAFGKLALHAPLFVVDSMTFRAEAKYMGLKGTRWAYPATNAFGRCPPCGDLPSFPLNLPYLETNAADVPGITLHVKEFLH